MGGKLVRVANADGELSCVQDMDMVEANLTIAEDRILSLESCIHNNSGRKLTKWALHALFFFEAELKLENFVKQRRRWNNGTAYLRVDQGSHSALFRQAPRLGISSWPATVGRKFGSKARASIDGDFCLIHAGRLQSPSWSSASSSNTWW